MKVVSMTLETNILFLPTISSPNQTFKLIEYGEYHQLKKLLIVRQILLVITIANAKRTVMRIWILMLRNFKFKITRAYFVIY